MTWFKVDTERARNRKTYRLADLLAASAGDLFATRTREDWRARAIALLDDFWAYVAEHHPDGDITDAHPDASKDAVRTWLQGTAWADAPDVRKLLVDSGHVDRLPNGRLRVHDWKEWSGSDLMRLAKDRKRKRLARGGGRGRVRGRSADDGADGDRTRPRKIRAREEKRREEDLKTSPAPRARAETWLTPYAEAWHAAYDGAPPTGEMARALRPFHEERGVDVVLEYWRNYLGATPARFASPSAFARTFGTWATAGGAPALDAPISAAAARDAFRAAGLEPPDKLPGEGFRNRAALERAITNARQAVA